MDHGTTLIRRPDKYDLFDLMVDLGLGAEANMMQQHIINSPHASPFTDVFELVKEEEPGYAGKRGAKD